MIGRRAPLALFDGRFFLLLPRGATGQNVQKVLKNLCTLFGVK